MGKFIAYNYLILLLRYLIIAGSFFLIFYTIRPRRFLKLRLQNKFPENKDYYREIAYSLLSFVFFALVVLIVFRTPVKKHTLIYDHISRYGWIYFGASIVFAIIIHDIYFYFTHRLMHHPAIFKAFHLVHHKSTNPSPWAAFAFHPLEAVVEAGILPVLVFVMPVNRYAILIFFLISTVINVYGHLGYEIYPAWLIRSKAGKWLNTSVSHNMHHKYFKGNYGFYTRIWDELFGTMNPDYHQVVDELFAGKNNALELP